MTIGLLPSKLYPVASKILFYPIQGTDITTSGTHERASFAAVLTYYVFIHKFYILPRQLLWYFYFELSRHYLEVVVDIYLKKTHISRHLVYWLIYKIQIMPLCCRYNKLYRFFGQVYFLSFLVMGKSCILIPSVPIVMVKSITFNQPTD